MSKKDDSLNSVEELATQSKIKYGKEYFKRLLLLIKYIYDAETKKK